MFISENVVYAHHLKKLSVDGNEYSYFDLPSLGPKYGKYVYVYIHVSQPIVSGTMDPVVLYLCGWMNNCTFLGRICLEVFKCLICNRKMSFC
jgi:hypothetical protein